MIMNRIKLMVVFLWALMAEQAGAQVVLSGSVYNPVEGAVRVKVLGEEDKHPIPYVAVYLVPQGDTLITDFTLTDSTGVAILSRVVRGKYTLHADMLGYRHVQIDRFFPGEDVILPDIILEKDIQLLEGASIQASVAPVEYLKDTVIFHASAFMIGQNAMLEDILRRMPGMRIVGNRIEYNGVPVTRFTVEGKTFFFDNPMMALQNLPARIVNKVKVVDGNQHVDSPLQEREKTIDLELHDEYKKGWFGNIRAAGGATIPGRDTSPVAEGRKFLYRGDALVAAYGEQDQLTVIAGTNNAPLPASGDRLYNSEGGIHRTLQGGINYNTQRIHWAEASGMMSFKQDGQDHSSHSNRTSFLPSGTITAEDSERIYGDNQTLRMMLELKEKEGIGKVRFLFVPYVSFEKDSLERSKVNSSYRDDGTGEISGSWLTASRSGSSISYGSEFVISIPDMKKENRILEITGNYEGVEKRFIEQEFTTMTRERDTTMRDYHFGTAAKQRGGGMRLTYVEPLGKGWSVKAAFSTDVSSYKEKKTCRENDGLSSYVDQLNLSLHQSLLAQYEKDDLLFKWGAQVIETQFHNAIPSANPSVQDQLFKKWMWDGGPYVELKRRKQTSYLSIFYLGETQTPSSRQVTGMLDPSVATDIFMGNIYLKPSYNQTCGVLGEWRGRNQKGNNSANVYGSFTTRDIVHAVWFDETGVRYSVPVNAQHSSFALNLHLSLSHRFSKKADKWLGEVRLYSQLLRSISYQNVGTIPVIDVDQFNYRTFIDNFWGDASGNVFYSGMSGFTESRLFRLRVQPTYHVYYWADALRFNSYIMATYEATRYGVDSAADTRTLDLECRGSATILLGKHFELETGIKGFLYYGYCYALMRPHVDWNGSLTYNTGPFAISLSFNDLFNSHRAIMHSVQDNSTVTSISDHLGRHVYLSLRWDFGKLNAARHQTAQKAGFMME